MAALGMHGPETPREGARERKGRAPRPRTGLGPEAQAGRGRGGAACFDSMDARPPLNSLRRTEAAGSRTRLSPAAAARHRRAVPPASEKAPSPPSLGLGLRLSNNTQECVGTFDDSSGLCCMGKDIVVLFAIGRT